MLAVLIDEKKLLAIRIVAQKLEKWKTKATKETLLRARFGTPISCWNCSAEVKNTTDVSCADELYVFSKSY